MECNGKLACPHGAQHLHAHQAFRENDCMTSIHGNRVERLQPRQWISFRRNKGARPAYVGDRATGFHAAQHIAFGQVLVFERDPRGAIDGSLLDRPEHTGRKRKSVESMARKGGFGFPFCGIGPHTHSLNRSARADRLAERRSNLLFRTAGPAFIEARVLDLDCKVIAGSVAPDSCAGGTL